MFIVWPLLGALVAWPVLGALIGIAAALWRGFSVAGAITWGVILGPMAFGLFFVTAEDMSARSNVNAMMVVDKRLSSRFVIRRCPECTGPNASLTYQGTTSNPSEQAAGDFVLWGHFVPPAHRQDVFTHRYRCIVCGYEWQFESPHVDPDKAPIRDF